MIRLNRSGLSVSSEILTRVTPASRSGCANSAIRDPLVVSTRSRNPGSLPNASNSHMTFRRRSGSPPVMRILLTPSSVKILLSLSTSSSVRIWLRGKKVMSSAMQ